MRKQLLLTLLLSAVTVLLLAQKPFESEIKKFQKLDSSSFPPKNAILFTGSSTIRLWSTLEKDFAGYPVINRGFGGATLKDLLLYVDVIVTPYAPKQVFIYCGENDFALDSVQGTEVAQRFKMVHGEIRKKLPRTRIYFISMKPSPSRAYFRSRIEQGNELIRGWIRKNKRTYYIDIYPQLLTPDGKERTDLYLQDMLHFNAKGYDLLKSALLPYLMK